MNACTQDARIMTCTGSATGFSASPSASYEQWNNDWKREPEQGSGASRIGLLMVLAAESVYEQRRKRERRQIE